MYRSIVQSQDSLNITFYSQTPALPTEEVFKKVIGIDAGQSIAGAVFQNATVLSMIYQKTSKHETQKFLAWYKKNSYEITIDSSGKHVLIVKQPAPHIVSRGVSDLRGYPLSLNIKRVYGENVDSDLVEKIENCLPQYKIDLANAQEC